MPFDQVYLSVLENDEEILDFCIKKRICGRTLNDACHFSNIQETKNQIKQVKEVEKSLNLQKKF